MSRTYSVPPDTSEKDKTIGGIFTIAQFAWLAVGAFICFVHIIIYKSSGATALGVIFGLPFLITGGLFAFYKKYEYTFFRYLVLKKKFNKKTKELMNRKEGF